MSTRTLSDNKTLISTKRSDGQLPQVQLKSLLTFCFAHGKPSNWKSNSQDQEANIQLNSVKLWLKSEPKKELLECTRVSFHSGQDKFLTPLSSSLPSNGSSNSSMTTSSPRVKKTTISQPNSVLPSLQVIWLVSSALLSHIPLTPSSQSFTLKVNQKDRPELRLPRFTVKSDSVDCGLVFSQELSWSVPWLVFNGGFMTASRLPSDFKLPVEDQKSTDFLRCDVKVFYFNIFLFQILNWIILNNTAKKLKSHLRFTFNIDSIKLKNSIKHKRTTQ